MKKGIVISIVSILCALPALALSFESAQEAYDKGDFEKARKIYTALLNKEHLSGPLFYNLGNTHYRLGQVGQAVLQYRRARFFLPRDPDLRANEEFARAQTGALPAAPSAFVPRMLEYFSFNEWFILGLTGFWTSVLLVGLLLLSSSKHPLLLRLSVMSVIILVISAFGMLHWTNLRRHPEHVITQVGVQALYSPLPGATPHFSTPEGSVLAAEEKENGWLRVTLGERSGWIQENQATPVTPFQ